MMFIFYTLIFSIISGLVLTTPIEGKARTEMKIPDVSIDEAFLQAEITLNRYFHLIQSNIDQLVHGLLYVIITNPRSFPLVPHRALDIALKNVQKKLGQNDLDILTRPLLLSIEENAQKKAKESSSVRITDEMKDDIEDTLDEFFASPM